MIIKVTKGDIKKGTTCCDACPVALAIQRNIKTGVWVLNYAIKIYTPNKLEVTIPLPLSVAKFIKKFDEDKKVKPFAFNLNLKSKNK